MFQTVQLRFLTDIIINTFNFVKHRQWFKRYMIQISSPSIIKGEALLTIGYTIFGNKSYFYIHSQISFHRKHEIIEQSGI